MRRSGHGGGATWASGVVGRRCSEAESAGGTWPAPGRSVPGRSVRLLRCRCSSRRLTRGHCRPTSGSAAARRALKRSSQPARPPPRRRMPQRTVLSVPRRGRGRDAVSPCRACGVGAVSKTSAMPIASRNPTKARRVSSSRPALPRRRPPVPLPRRPSPFRGRHHRRSRHRPGHLIRPRRPKRLLLTKPDTPNPLPVPASSASSDEQETAYVR